ncbi:MAG: hypothetical protein NBV60_03290 [Erythrobacter sp.]|nr:hypothetical protein [Erythrobacter sp.]
MTAHFNVNEIGFFSLEQWPVTVCAWRGCCIEVFARAEHSVAECLRALGKAGVAVGKDAHSPFAATRLKCLSTAIRRYDFGRHGKVALERIETWERVYEVRASLAHGRIKATRNGIAIIPVALDGKAEGPAPPRQISKLNMLKVLAEIEQAQIGLHQQLGQIKVLAPKALPIQNEPDPGSSPG